MLWLRLAQHGASPKHFACTRQAALEHVLTLSVRIRNAEAAGAPPSIYVRVQLQGVRYAPRPNVGTHMSHACTVCAGCRFRYGVRPLLLVGALDVLLPPIARVISHVRPDLCAVIAIPVGPLHLSIAVDDVQLSLGAPNRHRLVSTHKLSLLFHAGSHSQEQLELSMHTLVEH